MNDSSYDWLNSTLQRSNEQAKCMLHKVKSQNTNYTRQNHYKTISFKETCKDTTLDEAYGSVMKSLAKSTQLCLDYYAKTNQSSLNTHERRFCSKYLSPHTTK
ncbi:uncharacterized protein LOC100184007 [Ciona intestinalis]